MVIIEFMVYDYYTRNRLLEVLRLELYHSTTQKEIIIAQNKLKKNTRFKYIKYLEYMLSSTYLMKDHNDFIGYYPGGRTQAPFMGIGIYCFDNIIAASSYQSCGEFIQITYSDDNIFLNLDDPETILNIFLLLEEALKSIESKITDKDAVYGWKALLEILIDCVMNEFENCQPSVGLILFVLNYLDFLETPDLIARNFSIKSTLEEDTTNLNRYYLISNMDKIEKIC